MFPESLAVRSCPGIPLQCYPCSDSICLGSVSPSPYEVALHKSHSEHEIAPDAPPLTSNGLFHVGILA